MFYMYVMPQVRNMWHTSKRGQYYVIRREHKYGEVLLDIKHSAPTSTLTTFGFQSSKCQTSRLSVSSRCWTLLSSQCR